MTSVFLATLLWLGLVYGFYRMVCWFRMSAAAEQMQDDMMHGARPPIDKSGER